MKTNKTLIPGQPYIAPEAVVVELRTDNAFLQASQLEDYDENIIFSPALPEDLFPLF